MLINICPFSASSFYHFCIVWKSSAQSTHAHNNVLSLTIPIFCTKKETTCRIPKLLVHVIINSRKLLVFLFGPENGKGKLKREKHPVIYLNRQIGRHAKKWGKFWPNRSIHEYRKLNICLSTKYNVCINVSKLKIMYTFKWCCQELIIAIGST